MSLLNMSHDKNHSHTTSPEGPQRLSAVHAERDQGKRAPETSSAMPHQFTAVSKKRLMRSFRADPW
jgi:hypothetical protein